MSKRQVKLDNWPFQEGERAQLIWISSPFSKDKKIMIYAYFRVNGRTEKVLVDWGTLPALAIQHYYVSGDVSKSIVPTGTEEVEITIFPDMVSYFEREWSIYGTNDKDISRSFIVSYNNKKYILPLIEVVRSILAPNRFLLYRLFEINSFPQYFIEQYEVNKIHLDFSSQYLRQYTKNNFLYQLVWLLTNDDLRQVFENVAYTFLDTGTLTFDWLFKQPITIKAIVKVTSNGGTILRIKNVKNKQIPYSEISFTHPEMVQYEKSKEAKKYTFQRKQNSNTSKDEIELDETAEGTTDNFDLIEMDNQIHEYTELPKVTKIRNHSNKKRSQVDENTKRYLVEDNGRRSTADIGGNQVTRSIENQSLYEVHVQGELGEFIKVLKVLEGYPEIKSISVVIDNLPIKNDKRKFSYLEDGITNRKYVLATIEFFNGIKYKVIEVERENRSLSMLLIYSVTDVNWDSIVDNVLLNLVNSSGTWSKELIGNIRSKGILVKKAKHSKKNFKHRAQLLINKLLN